MRDKNVRMHRLHLPCCAMCSVTGLCFLLFISLFATASVAEEILIITHQNTPVSRLDTKQVANLFLGLSINNHDLIAYDLSDKKLRQLFYREITGMTLPSIRAMRARQVFTGRGRPPIMLKPDEVGPLLREKPGAVTYIQADQLPDDSKVLLTLETGLANE